MESIDITPTKVRGMGNVMKNNDDRTRIGIRNSVVEDDESLVEYDGAAWPVFNMTCHPRVNKVTLGLSLPSNKTVYTVLETIHLNISATNYNNNPIPNLSVQVLIDGSVLTTVTTNENGSAVYEFTRPAGTYSLSLASASSSRWDAATSTAKTISVDVRAENIIFDASNWNGSVTDNNNQITSTTTALKYLTQEFSILNSWSMTLTGSLYNEYAELRIGQATDGTGDYIRIYRDNNTINIAKVVNNVQTVIGGGNLNSFNTHFTQSGISISRNGNSWTIDNYTSVISGLHNTLAVKGGVELYDEQNGFSFSN